MHITRVSLSLLVLAAALVVPAGIAAQGGGKAEANRIKFPRATRAATLIGTLSNSEEMEFVFAARKGQRAVIKNSRSSLFDVRVFSTEFDVETEFDSSRTFTVDLPQTGDYFLFIRKKLAAPATARFSVQLTIR